MIIRILRMCALRACPSGTLVYRPCCKKFIPLGTKLLDWSLLLERESFFFVAVSLIFVIFFFLLRLLLAWYADNRLRVPRFHFRRHILRAGATFFHTPEIEE